MHAVSAYAWETCVAAALHARFREGVSAFHSDSGMHAAGIYHRSWSPARYERLGLQACWWIDLHASLFPVLWISRRNCRASMRFDDGDAM